MSNPYLISNLSVGHRLPNGWTVMAYCVSDRHAVILCSMDMGDLDCPNIKFASWTVSNDDLRSTANGNYWQTDMTGSFADFKERVADMYLLS